MAESRTSPRVIRALLRRNLVLRLRVKGLDSGQIAKDVIAWSIERGIALPKNYNSSWVRKDIKKEMALHEISEKEKAKQRILEDLRLDCLLVAIWYKVINNQDLNKIDVILKIMDLRAKMWGLDARPGR
jgi:hypothetical protein